MLLSLLAIMCASYYQFGAQVQRAISLHYCHKEMKCLSLSPIKVWGPEGLGELYCLGRRMGPYQPVQGEPMQDGVLPPWDAITSTEPHVGLAYMSQNTWVSLESSGGWIDSSMD